MATVGGFSRHKHLDELDEPLDTAEGVLSPATRKQRVMANIASLDDEAAIVGTIPTVSGMSVETFFDGSRYRTRFTCTAVVFGTQADNASLGSGLLIYTFPAAPAITVLGGFIKGTLLGTGSVLTDTPEVGLGSVIASGAIATLGAGAATMEDTLGPFVAASINNGAVIGANAVTGPRAIAAGGTKTVHLNIADGFADVTAAGTISFTGVIELEWAKG